MAFHNTGSEQLGGLIVMSLLDAGLAENLDPNADMIMVLFNATPAPVLFAPTLLPSWELNGEFTLHPVLANSADTVVRTASYDGATGSFTVPGRTTAVFVLPEGGLIVAEPAAVATAMPAPTDQPAAAPTAVPTTAAAPQPTAPAETADSSGSDAAPADGSTALRWGIAAGILAGFGGAYLLLRRRLRQGRAS